MTTGREGVSVAREDADRRCKLAVEASKPVKGWFTPEEARLLFGTALKALTEIPGNRPVVEIGSYCGKSTVVLGHAAQAVVPQGRVYAIDPHEGNLTTAPGVPYKRPPTLRMFLENIKHARVEDVVETIVKKSTDVAWNQPISMLFIDGLHTYEGVSSDYGHFIKWLPVGGYIAFHDVVSGFPGVTKFVEERLAAGDVKQLETAKSLVITQKMV